VSDTGRASWERVGSGHLRGAAGARDGSLMPSPTRDFAPGLHHVWVNATGREEYFSDDVDRLAWLRRLVQTREIHSWTCIVFCQLTTHVHLVLDVPDWSLPVGMKRLNLEYSRDFNARHRRVGQLVRRRYGSRRILSGTDLLGVYAYVVLNPVEAGLVRRPEDWRWSSHATTLGSSRDFPFVDASLVLAELGGSIEALRALVEARQDAYAARLATAGV
jgi:REP-associated tyrosine transposase